MLAVVRAAVVGLAGAVGLTGLGIAAGPLAVAGTVVTANGGLNVRSGPSTSASILGVLRTGEVVTVVGASSGGWTTVSYGGRTAYVASAYLASDSSAATAPTTTASPTGTAWTTAALNVRSGPSLSSPVVTVVSSGTQVTLTGESSNGYRSILFAGTTRWVSAAYLTTSSPTSCAALPTTSQVRATAALMIRTTSDASFVNLGDVPAGTILDVTGVTQNGVAQIVRDGALRWVNAGYIVPVGAAGPVASGTAQSSQPVTTCQASWYGDPQPTASGEAFDPNAMTAAHRTLPFGTVLKVTNQANGKSVLVRINDRGPYVSGRCLDLSRAAFAAIGNLDSGVITVGYVQQ